MNRTMPLTLTLALLTATPAAAQETTLYLRHNQAAETEEVTVDAAGARQACTMPCELTVPSGPLRVRAGLADAELDITAPEAVLRVDLGWSETEYGAYMAGTVLATMLYLGAAASSLVSTLVPESADVAFPLAIGLVIGGVFGSSWLIGAAASHPGGEIRLLGGD